MKPNVNKQSNSQCIKMFAFKKLCAHYFLSTSSKNPSDQFLIMITEYLNIAVFLLVVNSFS